MTNENQNVAPGPMKRKEEAGSTGSEGRKRSEIARILLDMNIATTKPFLHRKERGWCGYEPLA